jgi:hypothetical protein
MRIIGQPLRRRRSDSRGQALVEFAMVITMFITVVVAIIEFAFLFTSYVSLGFASHDASQMAATYGNTIGADAAVLERIDNDINTPANPTQIKSVDIFWVDTSTKDAKPVAGAETIYNYDGGSHKFTKPDGTDIYLPFVQASNGYPEATRCNVNQAVGCLPTGAIAHSTVDTIAVKITYQYIWITPFPRLVLNGSTTGPLMTSTNMMRLEPVL